MLMETLVRGLATTGHRGDLDTVEVASIEHDSRAVEPGALFCCLPGAHTDGHAHAAAAVGAGAVGLLAERPLDLAVPQVWVEPGTVRAAMAEVSSEFYGHPWRDLTMVGVTGTNGKTTVTHLVAAVLDAAGARTGVIGTLDGVRTTPEAPELERRLRDLRDDGHRAVAMEVSSHALDQHRVDTIVFDVAVFTNLSRDHLDHHSTMEDYFEAKATLFSPRRARHAVVATDGPWGRRLANGIHGLPVTEVRGTDAGDVVLEPGRTTFTWRGRRVTTRLTGAFNVENALLAATVASRLGVSDEQVVAGLARAEPVSGRMEVVEMEPFTVVVDYAHTPDGLASALGAARQLTRGGRVICMFGCGGDRDPGKRPDMGAVAERLADVVVLTSDNPRSEDPEAIIEDVRRGMEDRVGTVVEPDRRAAIAVALDRARPGDVVLLAGKGHERTQTRGADEVPFDDRDEARRALRRRGPGGGA
ncbi:MAG: UDP-N-acetylmuramoyl-L-alanyl-D-glutamate--2,6-diaminopimelate ligase [Acidimicrobiales bacterium]|nr:UDP-N-acetylmuramoyl-L-alanyl-D-glutamate--2,6-diaminopimelate ligase [Acidimicrobiales bacterium]